jgi:pSer/pThr/pTyr-binding forkhead associated (FHA) protein
MHGPPDARRPTPDPPPAGERPAVALWTAGEFTLRVVDAEAERTITVHRPYGLVGRIAGADLCLDDRAVSARHVYLHLDRRGLFGVDLATRTGTRFGNDGRPSGWLRPGQAFEVAGRRIELVDLRADGAGPSTAATDPLTAAGDAPLAAVTVHALHARHTPRALGSELVFIGRSVACGVRVEGATASRVHCVLVRTATAAYVVDLIGRGTWLNGQLVNGAAALGDGDALVIGSAWFRVRVTAMPTTLAGPPALRPEVNADAPALPATGSLVPDLIAIPNGPLSTESQGTILAWMMGALQASQAEALRRQGEFQHAMTELVQQMHRDHAALLGEQLERLRRIDEELGALRAEFRRRFGPPAASLPPLRLDPAPPTSPDADPAASATWLLTRINELENEHQSTWKDLLGRLARTPRRGS